jgi:hypothetical protein
MGYCAKVVEALRRSRQRQGWREEAERHRAEGRLKTAAFYHNLLVSER